VKELSRQLSAKPHSPQINADKRKISGTASLVELKKA
jgi:hypothetical protein